MVILQTLLGLVVVYLMSCSYLSWSGKFVIKPNKFIQFCLIVGNITISLVIIAVLLDFSYIIGSIILYK
ncbi:MAG TPA: hypothetical protein VIM42_08400 [Clostridium sp.]